jgi:hypothetical protein
MVEISDSLDDNSIWWRYQTVWRITVYGGDIRQSGG